MVKYERHADDQGRVAEESEAPLKSSQAARVLQDEASQQSFSIHLWAAQVQSPRRTRGS